MKKQHRELIRRLGSEWKASINIRGHLVLLHLGTGIKVTTSNTPSDARAYKNTIALCKRQLRGAQGNEQGHRR